MLKRLLASLFTFFIMCGASSADTPNIFEEITGLNEVNGYYKSILYKSQDNADGDDLWATLQRLRLQFSEPLTEETRIVGIFDQEFFTGNLFSPTGVRTDIEKGERSLLDLGSATSDKDDDLIYRFDTYRLHWTYRNEDIKVRVGRQRINWQKTFFWNPTDLFNPLLPTEIERSERTGADAVYFDVPWELESLSGSLNVVYNPERGFDENNVGVRVPIRWIVDERHWEIAPLYVRIDEDNVVGASLTGQLDGWGINSEVVYVDGEQRSVILQQNQLPFGLGNFVIPQIINEEKEYVQASIAATYAWLEGLTMNLEYFYNEGIIQDPFNGLRAEFDRIATTQKHFVNGHISYQYNQLLEFEVSVIFDAEGDSYYINPRVEYNLQENLDLLVGSQIYTGNREGSEFGIYEDSYYVWLQQSF